ncbi:sensor histidine kinase [Burkholderiaceae bacterium UC74_6]
MRTSSPKAWLARAFGFAVLACVLVAFGPTWSGRSLPLHSSMEMGGAVIGMMSAYVLLRLEGLGEGSSFNPQIAAGLIGMAVLDGCHAMVSEGQTFVALHSAANAVGGGLMALVWWTPPRSSAVRRRLPMLGGAVAGFVAAAVLLYSAEMPPMLVGGRFTAAAWGLNFGGGIGLLAAALRILLTCFRSRKGADLLFFLQCSLLGIGALLFQRSAIWEPSWWAWHAVRLAGYAIALWMVTQAARYLERNILNQRDQLEQQVLLRTAELQQSVDMLRATQEDLLQSEKLASLGAMVAGISHELNTPVGTAVTLASTLQDNVQQLHHLMEAGQLKKSSLNEFAMRSAESARLILACTQRAADLIASFKQVAIDQASERRREFVLDQLLGDLQATMQPSIKHTPVQIELDVERGLHCDGYPGPLIQVVSNLIQNAVLHAFQGRDEGVVRLHARRHEGEQIRLVVSDDGNGMEPHVLSRIFDPFFTTRLGQGGSGIGLTVCLRIANTVLGGSLVAESVSGQGTRFTLIFPAVAAGRM